MKQLIPKKSTKYGQLINEDLLPLVIDFNLFDRNFITFLDGEKDEAICLNCIAHPCINYDNDKHKPDYLHEMPHSHSTKVCPTDSIKLEADGYPVIISDTCIGCGLCLTRCNYAAINITENFKATINKSNSDKIKWTDTISYDEYISRENLYKGAIFNSPLVNLPKEYFVNLYHSLLLNCKSINGFENLFVRNLLINLGINNKVRAIGNNDIRFDLLGELEDKVLIGEIGLNGTDILEEPRAILDDIAVLTSRYKIEPKKIFPLIITLSFPNKRSDVYEVISDINSVLAIRIISLSVHLLIILNLFRRQLNKVEILELFYANKENKSIVDAGLAILPELEEVDPFFAGEFYQAVK